MTLPDRDRLADYGGALTNAADVIDNTTDRTSDGANAAYASIAAATQTATRCIARALLNTTCTLLTHNSVWGNAVTVAPAPSRDAAGSYRFTWPLTVTDELGKTHTLNLRYARCSHELASAARVHAYVLTANVVIVKAFDSSNAALDNITVTVWAG